MKISYTTKGIFGGRKLIEYIIENNNGIKVSVLNLGGIITGIFTPDRYGNYNNIVLGYEDINDYFDNQAYYGAIIGPFAGRIYSGKIELDGRLCELEKNNMSVNTLHGGSQGFHTQLWDVSCLEEEDQVGLILDYKTKNGEAGLPGEVKVEVNYVLNNDNELYFRVSGITDKITVLNITNHTYFNLSGDAQRNILGHKLKVEAGKFLELSNDSVPTGKVLDVTGTPFDFRSEKEIGKDITSDNDQLKSFGGYDHPFVFDHEIGFAQLKDEQSGRVVTVTTDNPCVVIYTTNFPVEKKLFNGNYPERGAGICLETQNSPIGVSGCNKEDSILKPNELYNRWTKYKFDLT